MLIIGIILVFVAVINATWTLEKLCEDKSKGLELEKVVAFGFGSFFLFGGVGVCLILIPFLGFNSEFKWALSTFVLIPAMISFIEGFIYKKKK